jgi:acyl-CoA synthetase (AMP-forming)/AMP-acid ligase II
MISAATGRSVSADPGFPPTVPQLLGRAVAGFPDAEFLVSDEVRLTFAQVDASSASVAAQLVAHGVGTASRVGILVGNRPEWAVAFLGVTRIGALAVPLSTFYRPVELAAAVRQADIQVLLVAPTIAGRPTTPVLEEAFPGLSGLAGGPLYDPSVPTLRTVCVLDGQLQGRTWGTSITTADSQPEQLPAVVRALEETVVPASLLAVILTSGTSGVQKAVVHTHGGLVRHAVNIAAHSGLRPGRRTFTSAPFFWVGGLVPGLLVHMYLGGTVLVLERLDPDHMFDFIDRERPDALFGFSLHDRLAQAERFATTDASWLPEPAVAHQGSRADGSRHNSLGMSETGGVHTAPGNEADRELPDDLRGAFGRAMPGIEHRIVEPGTNDPVPDGVTGEICVRGYSLMDGLYKRERADVFDKDGWYHTRDLGCLREGYLFFVGRADDLIKTKGANVSPAEVEAALKETGLIDQVCVVGVDDADAGQLVGAYVIPAAAGSFDPDSFMQVASGRLSSYKMPRRLVVADRLPVLTTGKVDKRCVVAELSAAPDARVSRISSNVTR